MIDRNDIQFKNETGTFNVRVVGTCLKDGKLLLSKGVHDDFWTFVGGKVKFGESTSEGTIREFYEETGARMEIDHLIAWIENFFNYNGEDWHQFIVFYLMKDGLDKLEPFEGERQIADDSTGILRWFGLSELEGLNIKPECAKKLLSRLEERDLHIINRD